MYQLTSSLSAKVRSIAKDDGKLLLKAMRDPYAKFEPVDPSIGGHTNEAAGGDKDKEGKDKKSKTSLNCVSCIGDTSEEF